MFSEEFTNSVALPMTALFLATGSATPEVPAIMLERLCTSPLYAMWCPTDKNTLVGHRPPMIVFPNFFEFYETWRKDLVSRGVTVRLSTELTEVVLRNKHGVANFYREDLAVEKLDGVDQTSRLSFSVDNYRPMYYIKMYPEDKSKLEICSDATNYQCQLPENVPFEQHAFQTIYLNEIRENRIIRREWWHQPCHSYTHYLFVVAWMMFLQAKNHTRFAVASTLVNAHEVAVISGIAAAVDIGAEYPEDLENDGFAFLCFPLYYPLAYGMWYRRKYTKNLRQPTTKATKEGSSWASGLHSSVYKGPSVTMVERLTSGEEVNKSRSARNLAKGSVPGRSQS
ncbi:hypothetical protein DL766_008125 [Monosporascus sp. MC13-8B]|uniref:Uncharacterized protein n=1 Tax=Monosporascus cannonballus TaxID=155416 RepID=A0ABY0H6V1_9PEZI|nr:hypothetical protein DL762_004746 [Monosporascus cannonballus]RYP01298.1 hypothetical protein DL763_000270 [Monosporascus cannonballus]RYP20670.1 hypothetical protein DL766_008125 [Monosporascus sp. MC13-8B]